MQALSEIQVKIGDYAFTTLRPVPSLVRIGGVLVQLVEIPGLIEGAHEDRGGGRALLGVLRAADAIVYCQDASAPVAALTTVKVEVAAAGIELPSLLAVTKMDDADPGALSRVRAAFPAEKIVPVSIIDDASLDAFKQAVWELTGLIRVYLRHAGVVAPEPLALPAGAPVIDAAAQVHNDLAAHFGGAYLGSLRPVRWPARRPRPCP